MKRSMFSLSKLIILLALAGAQVSCVNGVPVFTDLLGITDSGSEDSPAPPPSAPQPNGLKLDASSCNTQPLEGLFYTCEMKAEYSYPAALTGTDQQTPPPSDSGQIAQNSASPIIYKILSTNCIDLSVDPNGKILGWIKTNGQSRCDLELEVSGSGFADQITMSFTMQPSLSFSFNKDNIFLTDNGVAETLTLTLSTAAPYDTFVEFDIYGDIPQLVQGLDYNKLQIDIPQGSSQIDIPLSFDSAGADLFSSSYQKLQLLNGSSHYLPGVSLNTAASSSTPPSFEVISAGAYHTCGIDDGKLYCWGRDSYGQIGNGSIVTFDVEIPTQIGSSTTWQSISAGTYHTCGIDNGYLFCWGNHNTGRLGIGSTGGNVSSPTQVGSYNSWSSVAAGLDHTCAIYAAELYCWGSDNSGQLGNGAGNASEFNTPLKIGVAIGWTHIATAGGGAGNFTCGIESGKLFCWGSNSVGQLGIGSAGSSVPDPQRVGSFANWQDISLASTHACGIENDEVYCWGRDDRGQIGNSAATTDVSVPTQISVANGTWSYVATGYRHSCAINSAMELYCWGDDIYGQLGNGSTDNASKETPEKIGDVTSWTAISLGRDHSCGTHSQGMACWGTDYYGQIGNGSGTSSYLISPTQIGTSSEWLSLQTSGKHTCGTKEGHLLCWGLHSYGQLGLSSLTSDKIRTPTAVEKSNQWTEIATGLYHTCGVDSGKLFCWGKNNEGQVGNGTSVSSFDQPQQIGTSLLWSKISLGALHSCGILDKALYCWGENTEGQIGNNNSVAARSPELINSGSGSNQLWTAIAAGTNHTCGIESGKLYCWGDNFQGQLGDGSNTLHDSPIQVGTSSIWTHVATGNHYSCGINDGYLFCWGKDSNGQLGNGSATNTQIKTPERIGSSSSWTHIALATSHTCGIDGGSLFCWGKNNEGALGTNATSPTTFDQPQRIGTSSLWTHISTGDLSSSGIKDGKAYYWGGSSFGNAGSDSSNLNSPFLILETL